MEAFCFFFQNHQLFFESVVLFNQRLLTATFLASIRIDKVLNIEVFDLVQKIIFIGSVKFESKFSLEII